MTFLRLGKVFSSVITGNLALLGVAAGQLDAALALNAGLALGKLFTISLLALGVVALAAAIGAGRLAPAISSCFSARPAPSRTRPAEPSGDDG